MRVPLALAMRVKTAVILIITVVLVLSVMNMHFPSLQASPAVSYSDVAPGAWYYDAVMTLTKKGVISGYPNGTFAPERSISTAEMIKLVCASVRSEAYGEKGELISSGSDNWSDIWFSYAKSHGIIYDKENFAAQSSKAISRYKMALILSRSAAIIDGNLDFVSSGDESVREFIKDFNDIPKEYLESVTDVYTLGLIQGSDGVFGGARELTRAEAATIILRLIDETKRVDYPPGVTPGPNGDYGKYVSASPKPTTTPAAEPFSANYASPVLFLGDSLTNGLYLYGSVKNADFIFKVGLRTADAPTALLSSSSGKSRTLTDMLKEKNYATVFIMLGTNDLGSSASKYQTDYNTIVDLIRKYCPDAAIYAQTIPPVSREKSEQGGSNTRENVLKINEALSKLCKNNETELLDIYAIFADKNGFLPADYTTDGVHLTKDAYKKWGKYISG